MGSRLCFAAADTTVVYVRDMHATGGFNHQIFEGWADRIVCRTRKLNPPVWVPRASVWVRGKCEDALEARSRAGFNSHLVTPKNARGRVVQPADLHGVR